MPLGLAGPGPETCQQLLLSSLGNSETGLWQGTIFTPSHALSTGTGAMSEWHQHLILQPVSIPCAGRHLIDCVCSRLQEEEEEA